MRQAKIKGVHTGERYMWLFKFGKRNTNTEERFIVQSTHKRWQCKKNAARVQSQMLKLKTCRIKEQTFSLRVSLGTRFKIIFLLSRNYRQDQGIVLCFTHIHVWALVRSHITPGRSNS